GIVAKLVRRHPHVFADVTVSGADEVHRNWDDIKRAEREEKKERAERAGVSAVADGPPSSLDGVPFGQPALALAAQLQRRAARAGAPDELAASRPIPGLRVRTVLAGTSAPSWSTRWRTPASRDANRRWTCPPRGAGP